jgi:hypothetical protein
MSARQQNGSLQVTLDAPLRAVPIVVYWPQRQRPRRVTIDGAEQKTFDADGIHLKAPFRRLVAEW